jgi:deoxycytidylate deaminase
MIDLENFIHFREKQILTYKGLYNHVAMIFEKNNYHQPLCYGTNYLIDIVDNRSIHAEHDALLRLKKNESKKIKKINLMVIRYTNGGELCVSKPCSFCLEKMDYIASQKGYVIKKIYYSGYREIIKNTFWELYLDPNKHIPKRDRPKRIC